MKNRLSGRVGFALLLGLLCAGALNANEAQPRIEPRADEVLKKVSDYYVGLKSFGLRLSFSMLVQAPGTRRELWSTYDIAVERPGKAAIVLKDGIGATIVSDGKTMTTCVPAIGKFTKKSAPESLEKFFAGDDVALVNRSLGDMLFIGKLVKANPREAILEEISDVAYAGLEEVDGKKAHRLQLTRKDMKWNLWVQDGPEPLVRKLSPEISNALLSQIDDAPPQMKDTKMELVINFEQWNVKGPLPENAFTFVAPKDAEEVATLFEEEADGAPVEGNDAPATKLEMADGSQVDLADHKGKNIVVLDFWATWCAPCLQALPITSEVVRKYADKGVVFYSVNFNEDKEKIAAFMEKKNFDFKVALDKGGELAKQYGVRGIPFTVVIGKDGKILKIHSGLQPDFQAQLSKEIENALAQEIPVTADKDDQPETK